MAELPDFFFPTGHCTMARALTNSGARFPLCIGLFLLAPASSRSRFCRFGLLRFFSAGELPFSRPPKLNFHISFFLCASSKCISLPFIKNNVTDFYPLISLFGSAVYSICLFMTSFSMKVRVSHLIRMKWSQKTRLSRCLWRRRCCAGFI